MQMPATAVASGFLVYRYEPGTRHDAVKSEYSLTKMMSRTTGHTGLVVVGGTGGLIPNTPVMMLY